jgi:carbonic anhydrase
MVKSYCDKGLKQSPIEIKSKKARRCLASCDLMFYYRTSKCNMIVSNKNFIIDYDNGSFINFNHDVYEVHKISFSVPASHKVDGSSYPVEAHIYHRSANSGKILIIAVFLDINNAMSKSKIFLDKFYNSIPKKKAVQRSLNMPNNWNIYHLIPENKSFFLYDGSLPRYPCTENVTWVIFDNPVNCSLKFYENLKKVSGNNARNIQKFNNRTLYYNHNNSNKANRNYGSKLRCYTDKEFKKSCSKLVGNKDIAKFKSYQTLIIALTVVISLVGILSILWLIEQGLLKKTIKSISDVLNKKVIYQ